MDGRARRFGRHPLRLRRRPTTDRRQRPATDTQNTIHAAINGQNTLVRVFPGGEIETLASGDPLDSPADVTFGTPRGQQKRIYVPNLAFSETPDPSLLALDVGVPGLPIRRWVLLGGRTIWLGDEREPMQTAFHVSVGEPDGQRHALRNVVNLLADDSVSEPQDKVALVANGAAVQLFLSPMTPAAATVADLHDAGVDLFVCGNSLDRLDADDTALLPGVERVVSGVGTLASLQSRGFGYLKVP